jgi:hypothetical protein
MPETACFVARTVSRTSPRAFGEDAKREGRKTAMRLRQLTMGQCVYLSVISNPDGVTTGELVARMQEASPSMTAKHIEACAEDLLTVGYVIYDSGRWYAPGPKPLIWEAL